LKWAEWKEQRGAWIPASAGMTWGIDKINIISYNILILLITGLILLRGQEWPESGTS
jgi:hypothetical protein